MKSSFQKAYLMDFAGKKSGLVSLSADQVSL
ncbi:hypothetical protein STSP2_01666 [Anaerohalosphaera lusitana]|uniref:Uncharacterized protein n=1 Tax=Anaerohalosphaera lusitana TaxID=1936003 RepID=A0A1U9NKP2_9BACT|nr:hypothetical protein STSP2_01666 [Anaerohalosphaera lusitana]